jgi:hypothetical protein
LGGTAEVLERHCNPVDGWAVDAYRWTMEKWIPCGDKFITGDVIRWVEPVWKPKQKTERGEKIGYRLVVAQVMRCDSEWVSLEVMNCKHHLLDGWKVDALDGHIRRRRGPIGQGGAQRALVGDQEARAITASRYLNEPEGPPPEGPKAEAPHPRNWPPALPRGGGAHSPRKGYRRGRSGPKTRHVPKGKR